jgi:starch synthase
VGGLGDVIHGLTKQQIKDGHKVEVILPKYDIIDLKIFDSLQIYTQNLWSYEDNKEYHNTVYKAVYEGVTIFLIEPHHNEYYFNRGLIYGSINDVERFLFFCRASIEFLIKEKKYPNVLHLHDWMTAPIAPLIRFLAPVLDKNIGSIIFNIHNIEHQGVIHPKNLTRIGLKGETFLKNSAMADPKQSNLLITVSPSYAKEILTPEYGFNLHTTMDKFKDKLHGILNGIETETWNPSTDKYLLEKYPSNSTYINEIIRKKNINKQMLLKSLNMNEHAKGPLIICITRIVSQKSPELILHAIYKTVENGGCFILLGGIFEKSLEEQFTKVKKELENCPNVHLSFSFNEELSHKMFAASDAIFIPSKFEPCGLTQLIAMRYGSVPIVRNTGGLKDSVINFSCQDGNGFVFSELTTNSVDGILNNTFNTYINHQNKWQILMQNGMDKDLGWQKPAHLYEKVYLQTSKSSM